MTKVGATLVCRCRAQTCMHIHVITLCSNADTQTNALSVDLSLHTVYMSTPNVQRVLPTNRHALVNVHRCR